MHWAQDLVNSFCIGVIYFFCHLSIFNHFLKIWDEHMPIVTSDTIQQCIKKSYASPFTFSSILILFLQKTNRSYFFVLYFSPPAHTGWETLH